VREPRIRRQIAASRRRKPPRSKTVLVFAYARFWGNHDAKVRAQRTYARTAPIFFDAVGNFPIPAPTTSSATVT
jgi:hypothetical protein